MPFDAADGHDYQVGSSAVPAMPPETVNDERSSLPSNTTYGVTDLDGSGSANFDVWTTEDNASLGCSDTVPARWCHPDHGNQLRPGRHRAAAR